MLISRICQYRSSSFVWPEFGFCKNNTRQYYVLIRCKTCLHIIFSFFLFGKNNMITISRRWIHTTVIIAMKYYSSARFVHIQNIINKIPSGVLLFWYRRNLNEKRMTIIVGHVYKNRSRYSQQSPVNRFRVLSSNSYYLRYSYDVCESQTKLRLIEVAFRS